MRRLLFSLLAVTAVSCAQTSLMLATVPKAHSSELEVLHHMVGDWTGTAEFISPTPAEMQAMMREQMPDYEGEMPTSFKGGTRNRWILNGHFLLSEGWHEEGPGVKAYYTEIITWDPTVGKYHSWNFSNQGETGEGWWTFDATTNTFHLTWEGMRNGQPSKGKGSMSFPDADTMTWEWEGNDPHLGTMKMRGSSRRL